MLGGDVLCGDATVLVGLVEFDYSGLLLCCVGLGQKCKNPRADHIDACSRRSIFVDESNRLAWKQLNSAAGYAAAMSLDKDVGVDCAATNAAGAGDGTGEDKQDLL